MTTTAFGLGPRASRVLDALRHRIVSEDLPEGTKLPSHADLATTYGVAPLTMRQVLARLQDEGLVRREQGRGTFVQRPTLPAVLILEGDEATAQIVAEFVGSEAVRSLTAKSPAEALQALESDRGIALVIADVHVPDADAGREFVRAARRRWVDTPLVAITSMADDLAPLHGTPEWPVLVVSKPFVPHQMRQAITLALGGATRPSQGPAK